MTIRSRRQAKELGRRGGLAKAAKLAAARVATLPPEPFAGTFPDFLSLVGMGGPSWAAWFALWRATDALPLA
ncbi:MAG: hypothetical protein ABR998_03515 [Gemmatimonadales bacterium]